MTGYMLTQEALGQKHEKTSEVTDIESYSGVMENMWRLSVHL